MTTDELDALVTISKKAALAWRRRFEQSLKPGAMIALVEELRERAGDRVITAPHFGFWREAFVGSQFANYMGAEWVRLIAPPLERPDFEMLLNGAIHQYEVTEADRPNRRRHDEYREAAVSGETWCYDHVDGPEEVVAILARATEKKVAKAADYNSHTSLIIYLNVWCAMPDTERYTCFREGTRAAQGVFSEVWVLKNKPERVW